jgi:thioredoxin-dependent peroxiredoxin
VIGEGERAPDFTLRDQDGEEVTLSSLRGQQVVLYFYPKASTPGCTKQACGIRDHSTDYADLNARVLGVSPDPVSRVKKFHDDNALDFTLLADEHRSVCAAYGVKKFWGAQRTTFVIDAEGTVARVLPKVSPKTHDDAVLQALQELAA